MNNDQIIQKIKDENIRPIPKKVFLFRKIIIWFLLSIATVFGAYAFALFFIKTLFIDFDNWVYFSNSYNIFLLKNIPIIWMTLFLLSLISVFYLFKKTNRGYRHSILIIATTSIFISFILGIALSKIFIEKSYFLQKIESEAIMNWTSPEEGRLSGEVLFYEDQYLIIRDIEDDIWNIDISYILDNSRYVLENNHLVSIIGIYDYENNFTACQIIPLNVKKDRFSPNPKNKKNIAIQGKDNNFVQSICDFVIKGY